MLDDPIECDSAFTACPMFCVAGLDAVGSQPHRPGQDHGLDAPLRAVSNEVDRTDRGGRFCARRWVSSR